MDEWKAVACTEVSRAKEKYNAGLTGAQHCNQQACNYGMAQQNQNQQQALNQTNLNSHIIPMDVDVTTTTTNFKKLTPEECMQLAKEGRCFRCHLQGHMAHHCPNNQNKQTTNSHADNVEGTTDSTTTTTTTPTPSSKLMHAQQI